MSNWEVRHGDCRDVMRSLPPESVDAIVSDPPYGLSFMGKEWDHGVPGVEFWTEALRVAKPGAYLVAFGGTRTYHRLAVAIEDAGWEVRDCLSWLYGSGFPKSLAVDKAIDKMDATEEQMARRYRFTTWVRESGITIETMWPCLMPFAKNEATAKAMAQHYVSTGQQPAIMTLEHLDAVRHLIGEVPEWVERECAIRSVESKNFAEREVVGRREVPKGHAFASDTYGNTTANVDYADTAPATDAAKRWHGWGTALKPAWEPIILARKPLTGTVAANVTQYGTGAINVDGCRIGTEVWTRKATGNSTPYGSETTWSTSKTPDIDRSGVGRWPANVCLDEDAAALLDAQSGERKAGVAVRSRSGGNTFGGLNPKPPMDNIGYGDTGGASRFFYTAKVSRREREAGLDGMPNAHPTLKPIALMRWLCRLVTPPGGLILDPFNGSGSTGCAAVLEGFRYLGAELEAEYVEIARRRIAYWEAQRAEPDLFG